MRVPASRCRPAPAPAAGAAAPRVLRAALRRPRRSSVAELRARVDQRKAPVELAARRCGPRLHILARSQLCGANAGLSVGRRQYGVHLARGAGQAWPRRAGSARLPRSAHRQRRAGGQHHHLLHGALEQCSASSSRRHPVEDETLHHAERERRAVGAAARDLSEQRRDVGVTLLGQVTAHLGLGVRHRRACDGTASGCTVLADDQRAVGLLGGDRRTAASAPSCSSSVRPTRIELQFATALRFRHARPSASSSTKRRAKLSSANASVRKPTRRPRRTRASASCCGSARGDRSSEMKPNGSR